MFWSFYSAFPIKSTAILVLMLNLLLGVLKFFCIIYLGTFVISFIEYIFYYFNFFWKMNPTLSNILTYFARNCFWYGLVLLKMYVIYIWTCPYFLTIFSIQLICPISTYFYSSIHPIECPDRVYNISIFLFYTVKILNISS